MDTQYKVEYEWFFGMAYKGFCGKCGRILFTGGAFAQARSQIKKCPHCGAVIDWEDRNEKQ